MKKTTTFFALVVLPILFVSLFGGCIYTSNVVFTTKDQALYCFYDDSEKLSYLYEINFRNRETELMAKFDNPIFAIALSEDRETLFYFQVFEATEPEEGDDKAEDTLALKRLSLKDLSDTAKAELVCSFEINAEAGINIASTFGAATIIPVVDKEIAFVNYVKDESLCILSMINLKNDKVTTIDKGIVLYPGLSPNGKFLAYSKAQISTSPEEEKEEEQKHDSVVIVMDTDTMKKVEQKDVGKWAIPPQFAFDPSEKEGYKIFYPTHEADTNQQAPKGVSVKKHYLESIQFIAGKNRLAIYSPEEGDNKRSVEITDLSCNIIERLDRNDFIPLAWSPDDRFLFLGANKFLAQYVIGNKNFLLYEFTPPGDESENPEVKAAFVRELPDEI